MNRLRELRKAKGLTQVELSKFIGITQNNYSYWENGKVKIDNESVIKLAAFFGVSTDYLLGLDLETNSNQKLTAQELQLLNSFRIIGYKFGAQCQEKIVSLLNELCDG